MKRYIISSVLMLIPFLLWAVQSITIIPAYSMSDYNADIEKLYAHQPTNLLERLNYFSAAFLGKKYENGALGEGSDAEFDQNPVYRTDAFDCVTYVSTVLALINSHNLQEFQKTLEKINYKNSQVLYQNRYHFTSVDWNPNNEKQGFIQDITDTIHAQNNEPVFKIMNSYINKKAWYREKTLTDIKRLSPLAPEKEQALLQELRDLSEKSSNQESHLPYIPLTVLFDKQNQPNSFIFEQIPSNSIVEIVRDNWKYSGTDLDVSHMGFVLKTRKGLIYREASTIENKVIDIPLIDYLSQYLNDSDVVGINIQRVLF